jgi:hypothetical protein
LYGWIPGRYFAPHILISACILLLRQEHTFSYHTIYFWTSLLMYTKVMY